VCSSSCADGTIIACGAGTGQCSAFPGQTAAPTSACSNAVCYRGASNNTCYCAPDPCTNPGQPCPGFYGCCGACVGGTCT
jgi:hypothetical protein